MLCGGSAYIEKTDWDLVTHTHTENSEAQKREAYQGITFPYHLVAVLVYFSEFHNPVYHVCAFVLCLNILDSRL